MQGDKKGARRVASIAVALVVLVGLAGAGIFLPTYSLGPGLETPDSVTEGHGLYGSAVDDHPPITVDALLDGVDPLEYSPDTSTDDNGVNHFCFPVPVGTGGHFVVVEARNTEGYPTARVVQINPAQ
jgi:hypothetical protein